MSELARVRAQLAASAAALAASEAALADSEEARALGAADLAERFQRRKGLGASSVKAELGKRLIDPAAIDAAIAELPGDQLELATEEARKRLSRLKGLDKETLNRRLYAYLARRGFRGPEISNAIKAALEESVDNVTRVTFR